MSPEQQIGHQHISPLDAPVAAALPLLLRIPTVMHQLGSSRSAVYELIASGDLQTAHLGRAVRVTRESLLALVARRTEPARHPPAPSETRELLSNALARQGLKPPALKRGKHALPNASQP
jgi:predicted DNA-binding transcriptional regulator AlpA